ncbi:hypothetical protein GGR57DRAFT_201865 [Xylariaceae sp. FL1272]|nr:hypothetical protein GGR57DRAFT_201865 [Xylariaceae sp. FL1272]
MLATMAVGRPIRPAALFSAASPHRFRFLRRRGPSASPPRMGIRASRGQRREKSGSEGRLTGLRAATALHVTVAIAVATVSDGSGFSALIATEATTGSQWNVVGAGDSLISPRHVGVEAMRIRSTPQMCSVGSGWESEKWKGGQVAWKCNKSSPRTI